MMSRLLTKIMIPRILITCGNVRTLNVRRADVYYVVISFLAHVTFIMISFIINSVNYYVKSISSTRRNMHIMCMQLRTAHYKIFRPVNTHAIIK